MTGKRSGSAHKSAATARREGRWSGAEPGFMVGRRWFGSDGRGASSSFRTARLVFQVFFPGRARRGRTGAGRRRAIFLKERDRQREGIKVERDQRTPATPAAKAGGNDRFLPTRVTLLSRLRDWEDRASWQEFFDTYWRLIYRTARRSGLGEEEAQDVVQDVLVGASKALPGFKYDRSVGSFKGWLMTITRRKIADQFARRPPWDASVGRPMRETDAGQVPLTPEDLPAPREDAIADFFEAEWRRNLVAAAMRRVRGKVSHRQFQIFDLYVNQERPVSEVCAVLRVSRGQVYLARHRVARRLREEVARLEEETGEPPTP